MTRAFFILLACALSLAAQDLKSIDTKSPVEAVTYKGRQAIHFSDDGTLSAPGGGPVGTIKGSNFHDGTIELDIAGSPGKGAIENARGFVGIAFRLKDGTHYECVYLRPTNGRADDQLRRNHSVQYVSEPEFPWPKLRNETPGVYESYADLVTGEWTHVKLVVSGLRVEVFVNGASQPCLIVKDMKKGDTSGVVALWIGPGTDAYFANLKITPSEK